MANFFLSHIIPWREGYPTVQNTAVMDSAVQVGPQGGPIVCWCVYTDAQVTAGVLCVHGVT